MDSKHIREAMFRTHSREDISHLRERLCVQMFVERLPAGGFDGSPSDLLSAIYAAGVAAGWVGYVPMKGGSAWLKKWGYVLDEAGLVLEERRTATERRVRVRGSGRAKPAGGKS